MSEAADRLAHYLAAVESCYWCGRPLLSPPVASHLDHVIPRALGGADTRDNLVCACTDCNLSKGAKLPWEWLPARPDLWAACRAAYEDRPPAPLVWYHVAGL